MADQVVVALTSYNLEAAEKKVIIAALEVDGTILGASQILGITRHALKRRIIKHRIMWPLRTCAAPAPAVEGVSCG